MRVSLCKIKTLNKCTNKPLPKGFIKKLLGLLNEHKEIPSCIPPEKKHRNMYLRASYTVEAAMIIPMIIIFWMGIMMFFRILQVQTQVTEAINYAGRKVAVESYQIESDSALLLSAKVLFVSEIKQYDLVDKYVKGGKYGISLINSHVSGNNIELVAEYKVDFPIKIPGLKTISLEQHSCHRKWTGKQPQGDSEEYVYYTDSGKAYHLTSSCNYLDLSIHAVNFAQISGLRNKNAHKYSACTCVAEENIGNTIVYITDYGNKYHISLQCSGLKRTIHMVKKSEVGNRKLCSKCQKTRH